MDTNEMLRLIRNLIRSGRVTQVDHANEMCRVQTGDLHTAFLNWLAPAAGETREWHPPSIGEQVVVLCLNGDPAQGIVLRGLSSDHFRLPSHHPHQHVRSYHDGAVVGYDTSKHALNVSLPSGATLNVTAPGTITIKTKSANIQADSIRLQAASTTCTGNLLVKGALAFEGGMSGKGGAGQTIRIDGSAAFSGNVIAGDKSVAKHNHQANGENAPKSPPL